MKGKFSRISILKKGFISAFITIGLMFQSIPTFSYTANSSTLLYKYSDVQTLTRGVTYEESLRLYKDGWMNVYILTLDMGDENCNGALEVIESVSEFGLKKSVENIAKENNVIAAVNGDFFSSGNPKSSMGQVLSDGKIEQAQNYYNGSENRYAGLFIDNSGVPFIDYLKTQIGFYNSNETIIELQAKNKYTDFSKPVYFDRNAMTSTAQLDNRVKSLYKIVVDNGAISHISYEGETVQIPENGYIIVMNRATAKNKLDYYSVGQHVSFVENGTFVFRPQRNISEIAMGISGGGEVLRNGSIVSSGLIIGKDGRNPRTAIGVNKEKTKVIIMAVDGRRNGIGATHDELGVLLLEYGAYDAIHLDGGGSTTMVVKKDETSGITVENVPSEGSQRSVANAIGIKAVNPPTGELKELELYIEGNDNNVILTDIGANIGVKGFDTYHNAMDVDINNIQFSVDGVQAEVFGNRIVPSEEGNITISASVNGNVLGTVNSKAVSKAVSINASISNKALSIGDSAYLTVYASNKDGFLSEINYNDINWTIDNTSIGYIENGKFTALSEGSTNVTAEYNGLKTSISINVGKITKYITSFEENRKLKFVTYPSETGISGGTGMTNGDRKTGNSSLLINYKFLPNATTTQTVYASFEENPFNIENATDISLWLKGDGSGNIFRAVLKDANNSEYDVEFTNNIDFYDWQYLSAKIPENLSYPIRLESVYVSSLNTVDAVSGTLYIDDISVKTSASNSDNNVSDFSDYLNRTISGAPNYGEHDVTVFGQTQKRYGNNIEYVAQTVISKMKQNARAMYFVGRSDVSDTAPVSTVQWKNKYETTNTEYVSIVSLATENGSIRKEDLDQWRWLQGYLNGFSKNNVIIGLDKDIWGNSGNNLSDYRERNLLHQILKDFVRDTGKNVIVVAATGYKTGVYVQDGVRYITLNGLSAVDSNDLSSFKYLRIRANENEMYYDIQNVF